MPTSRRSAELFLEAKKFLAGGVSRNTVLREPHPLYAASGSGCRIVDVDGVERIDFANNMASLIHGHAHPAIVEAITAQAKRGTAFTLGTEAEIEYARHLCSRSAGFDKIRFVNSGTEAIMTAIKAARALTARPKIAKTEGAYHGAYDYAEVSVAPTPATWGDRRHPSSVPVAVGTPPGVLNDVVVLPFNDPEAAVAALDEHRAEIAGVLVDPIPHRLGLVPADETYVQALAEWARANGALLIFDEVITFRTELGGMQDRYAATPDLTAMGKIIGGGLPVGALAGRDEAMAVFTAQSRVPPRLPHSGTFSANPLTMAAGLAAMRLFDAAAIARLNELGALARRRIEEAIAVSCAPASVTGAGSLLRVHMRATPPRDYRSCFLSPAESETLRLYVDALFDEGLVPVQTGAVMLSTPMGEAEIDRLAEGVLSSLRKVRPRLVAEADATRDAESALESAASAPLESVASEDAIPPEKRAKILW